MEQIHGGNIYGNEKILYDFSVNGNPLGMPEGVKRAILSGVACLEQYPDLEQRALKKEIQEWEHQYCGICQDTRNILAGNGASELIQTLVETLRPRRVLLPVPAFSGYERACQAVGSQIVYEYTREEKDFVLQKSILEQLEEEIDLCILCNPSNPVGVTIPKELLERIVRRCEEKGIYLMVDECFLPFLPEFRELSAASLLPESRHLIVLRAFTKLFACPGIRLGYAMCCHEELVKNWRMHLPEWNVSGIAQLAGVAALQEHRYIEDSRNYIAQERGWMREALQKLGYQVFPSQADYLFFAGEDNLYEKLLEQGILIRRCNNYVGLKTDRNYYRVAIKRHEENEMLLAACCR